MRPRSPVLQQKYIQSKTYFSDDANLLLACVVTKKTMLLVLGLTVYWSFKKRKEVKQRRKNFKRNGGYLLAQQLSSKDGLVGKTRVFTLDELNQATNDFHVDKIIGQGAQGTVYKGVLNDGRIVAVKKSKKFGDDCQLQQFRNEVIILSQLNHRNIVKLLGCCLETKIPLLVYEFISKGTLAQHIHSENELLYISWKMRLQIAADCAGAIAYLHSSSCPPIYHRDIKSSNILLDENYVAKVSDFGISKTISLQQTHLSTQVIGTQGYLDPEYCNSSHFTERSDVYSFGVVLMELLTSKKALFVDKYNERTTLSTEVISAMENLCLIDILDPRVSEEADKEEIRIVAELARDCLNSRGKHRPLMKKVTMVLEELISCHECSTEQEPLSDKDLVYASTSELDSTTHFFSSTSSS